MRENFEVKLDGVSSLDVGIFLQKPVEISAPVPNVKNEIVPGRNGDLHYWDGSYKNRTGKAEAYTLASEKVALNFGAINSWLFSAPGYRRFETSEDDEHFMMGKVVNGGDVEVRAQRLAPFEMKFDLKPQRFLKSGEEILTFDIIGEIENPTVFDALPIIHVFGDGSGNVSINDRNVRILDMAGEMILDCETENAYSSTQGNLNAYIEAKEFPVLTAGTNLLIFTGGVTSVKIVPRWWEL